jgi:hypothetical protein
MNKKLQTLSTILSLYSSGGDTIKEIELILNLADEDMYLWLKKQLEALGL